VFELGHTYLQLVRTLNLRLPLVDPSHYISRFASLLEFGDETHIVAHDAVRLVQRFDRDWMTKGRRPAGICGAALLLAARMNNFRRSIEEIVQVVKIADTTLKKRLDEFRKTPSGSLTLADFRSVWLDEEMDPPAFMKAREKAEGEKAPAVAENGGQENVPNDRIFAPPQPLFIPDYDSNMNIDPVLLPSTHLTGLYPHPPSPDVGMMFFPPTTEVDETASIVLAEEVSTFLQNPQGSALSEALDEAEQRRLAHITVADELAGLDEEELDRFLLTEDEVKIKERVWVELNKEYLEDLAGERFDILL
jgi:transcription factor IIIB subunit 2